MPIYFTSGNGLFTNSYITENDWSGIKGGISIFRLSGAGTNPGLDFDMTFSNAFPRDRNRPYFVAQGTSYGINFSSDYTIPFTYQLWNNGSHYNTGTYRFTAPITGYYYFTSSCFLIRNTTSAAGYVIPYFTVNTSPYIRKSAYLGDERRRGSTYFNGGYYSDTQMNDILFLQANDYVSVVLSPRLSSSWSLYTIWSTFGGFLLS